jgi:hypothetical protein
MPIVASKPNNADLPTIFVELDAAPESVQDPYGDVRGGRTQIVLDGARDIFGDGLELVRACSVRVAAMLDQMAPNSRLEEVTFQLAVKLDSEVGAVIAKASAGAQFQVELKWNCRPNVTSEEYKR